MCLIQTRLKLNYLKLDPQPLPPESDHFFDMFNHHSIVKKTKNSKSSSMIQLEQSVFMAQNLHSYKLQWNFPMRLVERSLLRRERKGT